MRRAGGMNLAGKSGIVNAIVACMAIVQIFSHCAGTLSLCGITWTKMFLDFGLAMTHRNLLVDKSRIENS